MDTARLSKKQRYIEKIKANTAIQLGRPMGGQLCSIDDIDEMVKTSIEISLNTSVIGISTRMLGIMAKRCSITLKFRNNNFSAIKDRGILADGIYISNLNSSRRENWACILSHEDRAAGSESLREDVFLIILDTLLLMSRRIKRKFTDGCEFYVCAMTGIAVIASHAPSILVFNDTDLAIAKGLAGVVV